MNCETTRASPLMSMSERLNLPWGSLKILRFVSLSVSLSMVCWLSVGDAATRRSKP